MNIRPAVKLLILRFPFKTHTSLTFSRPICHLLTFTARKYTHRQLLGRTLTTTVQQGSSSSTNMNEFNSRLVWVDLEMTGLDVNKCQILEMACLVTDASLNIIDQAPNLVIHQPEADLAAMDEWCTTHHTQSGLVDAVRASKVSIQEAENVMVSFIQRHTAFQRCPIAGNTVHVDKEFLVKYMPRFMKHLHYRIVDVSTIKELCRRWYPHQYYSAPSKRGSHRALDDILESIKELNYYRQTIFR